MNCLVIGYGSIGKRHGEVLRGLGHNVFFVSRHAIGDGFFKTIETAFSKEDFNYVVIASPTYMHEADLRIVSQFVTSDTHCLVEKPLFAKVHPKPSFQGIESIGVGYVLRFHPLLEKAYQYLKGKRLISCRSSVGQYLPDWRPGNDYRQCYSSHSAQGGGVLRDLSHELDYMQWLSGEWKKLTAMGGHYSELVIDSEDVYEVLWSSEQCPVCSCHLDYLSRSVHRELFVEYEGGSLYLDFIKGILRINGIEEAITLQRNEMFARMHIAFLSHKPCHICSYNEAFSTVKMIDACERAVKEGRWITNV